MKTCKSCGISKHIDQFPSEKRSKDGRAGKCRDCTNAYKAAWARANPEKRRKSLETYSEHNQEKIKESKRRHYAANRSAIIHRASEWKKKNKRSVSASSARYYIENRDAILGRNRKWIASNPDKARAACHRRRARRLSASGSHDESDIQRLFIMQRGKCACCKIKLRKFHVDHIYPLSNGGTNDRSNLQLLCGKCNHQKHAKDPISFMQSRGFLL